MSADSPPIGVKLAIEGEEDTASHLHAYVEVHPDLFDADVVVVADMGNLEVGCPALTTTLRGDVTAVITVRTLAHAVHSGEFGGPVPDAMMALVRILDSFVDGHGGVAVSGLEGREWSGADLSASKVRRCAGLLDGVALLGSGSLASQLWARPTATVIGVDAPAVEEAANVLLPEARESEPADRVWSGPRGRSPGGE